MNNMNFTDWQDLWLKKDVEKIAKSINSSPDFSMSIIVDLIIATLALALTAISIIDQNADLVGWIIFLAVLSVLAPLAIIGIYRIRKHRKIINNIKKKKMPVKEYVSAFDNKVCNSAMMADSLFEHMKVETDFPAKYYCICEINYFINKCIDELFSMKNISGQIFTDATDGCVSPKRLRLVIKLLHTLRAQTYAEMKKITDTDAIVEEYINAEINKHDERIIKFVNEFNTMNPTQPPILQEWGETYKMMKLTMEELCLLAVYNIQERAALAVALRENAPGMEEPEMRKLAESVAAKLEAMTDAEFAVLDRAPKIDSENEDTETEE